MIYRSTRSNITATSAEAVLQGIAPDGGLYVAELSTETLDWKKLLRGDSLQIQADILSALLDDIHGMEELTRRAYAGKFETEELTPLVPVGENYVLELFRGPTCAFKDVALSVLPHLMTAARAQEGVRGETVILTATSGDTGKAALEGFHDVEGTRIFVFYPHNGVSAVQKAQMATQTGGNVTVCAVHGNFDDCQTGVKNAFARINSRGLLDGNPFSLSSANSINIGRLAPQLSYYFIAYKKLVEAGRIALGDSVDFVVPTGNFGDILAGFYAKLIGLPVGRLVCASNANSILTDFLNTGVYDRRREFYKTDSPSMDILVSSNLERLLYLSSGGDWEKVSTLMKELSEKGFYTADGDMMAYINESFRGYCCNERETAETIRRVWEHEGYLMDTHTAVAWNAAEKYRKDSESSAPVVVLSTASPYKFASSVLCAVSGEEEKDGFAAMEKLSELTGAPVPKSLSELAGKPELHRDVIQSGEITDYILQKLKGG